MNRHINKNKTNKADVLLGLQWGDEGKGKIVDLLTPGYNIVARFQGGPNAGHTLEFDGQKHVLHLIPSGIFHPGTKNFLGNGMAICPIGFKKEITNLLKYMSLSEIKERIVIARQANIIIPSHRVLDGAKEVEKGVNKIGSTKQGMGPVYTDHYGRIGLRVSDILEKDFTIKFSELQKKHITTLKSLKAKYDTNELAVQNQEFMEACQFMREFNIVDGPEWILDQRDVGKDIFAEGAQGTRLDIDFGDYPFVTSSHTVSAGACIGTGLPPTAIGNVYGLFKAYCTRVGKGPFPTELGGKDSDIWCETKKPEDELREYPHVDLNDPDDFRRGIAIRRKGKESGSTTGRLRRTGWLDLPLLKHACRINGVTHLIMSKADVLADMYKVKVCISYDVDDTPIYKEFNGWGDISKYKHYIDLPPQFKHYVSFIENYLGIKIWIISTGPDREQIIYK